MYGIPHHMFLWFLHLLLLWHLWKTCEMIRMWIVKRLYKEGHDDRWFFMSGGRSLSRWWCVLLVLEWLRLLLLLFSVNDNIL